jgi:Mg2+ and Co2+ transporter CorA
MRDQLKKRCDAIEEAYEFMLAYAAQGLSGDAGSQTGGQLRHLLTKALKALGGLDALIVEIAEKEGLQPEQRYRAFAAMLGRDADNTSTILQLVLSQTAISSQLVDNVNASIHVRTLLTDLFVIDEILSPQPSAAKSA